MIQKTIVLSGGAAVGKTAVCKAMIPYLQSQGKRVCVCKIDCIASEDQLAYEAMGIPCVAGISGDICPDHFLVSNLCELWNWGGQKGCDLLLIETAGLCNRCSPATEKSVQICVADATASCKSPQKLGPMLTQADMIVLTKIDMVSQAEREILQYKMRALNEDALIFPVDGLAGFGAELLARYILHLPDREGFEGDRLRHTMPAGVCSYCIGERRIGAQYQQGVVGKIEFGGAVK